MDPMPIKGFLKWADNPKRIRDQGEHIRRIAEKAYNTRGTDEEKDISVSLERVACTALDLFVRLGSWEEMVRGRWPALVSFVHDIDRLNDLIKNSPTVSAEELYDIGNSLRDTANDISNYRKEYNDGHKDGD
jgi:hypothetical protein